MKKLFILLCIAAAFGAGWYGALKYGKNFTLSAPAHATQDPAAAREIYAQKAAAGDPQAAYQLGELYLSTQGGPADPQSAVAYFHLAAGKGFAPAQKELARFIKRALPACRPTRRPLYFGVCTPPCRGIKNAKPK